jgi:hypothetical protein
MSTTPNDFLAGIEKHLLSLGSSDWIEVYRREKTEAQRISLTSGLIPEAKSNEVLSQTGWVFDPQHLTPCCVKYGDGTVAYLPFGSDEGYEPFVIERHFHGIKPEYVEIKEEFRLFHNLYFDSKNRVYIKINKDGSEQEVVRVADDVIKVRAVELRQFLAIKEMRLALLFDIRGYYQQTLEQMSISKESRDVTQPQLHYSYIVDDSDFREGSLVLITGKKLIAGFAKEDSGFWPYDESDKDDESSYLQFIVEINEKGQEVSARCLPYGENYLTPVYFRSEVLNRYYENSSKFSVEDGYLRCGSLWGVQIDNDNPRYVTAFLGDLGRDLPESERSHWRAYNIPPAGGISDTAWKRSFEAEFADPTKRDLVFKQRFNTLQEKWHKIHQWPLFKPLAEHDEHCFGSLRIPATDEQNEFDAQVMNLTKLLVDSINEAEIGQQIQGAPEQKGIGKLEEYLKLKNLPAYEKHVKFLRELQSLRSSGAAHRKSKSYEKAAKEVGLHEKDIRDVYEELLGRAIDFLNALESLT